MRKFYTIVTAILLTTSICLPQQVKAQSPEKMSYQAVIRDVSDNLVTNTSVGIQISILQSSATGTPVYIERQFPTTNINGLVSIEIGGSDATVVSGDFSTIDWSNGIYFIKTETDLNGGSSYTISGTSQILSVPYALHAKTAEKLINGNSETLIIPQSGQLGNSLDVSFSGGSDVYFTEASPVAIQFSQATSLIYPEYFYHINNKRVDAHFYLPSYIGIGTYDIIINPTSENPVLIEKAFKVFDRWGF